jgi:peroxiredoxin (alkyl hydroperoxide reductase subunit C)
MPATNGVGAAIAAGNEHPITSMPRIGDTAPDFKAMTTIGELNFAHWQGDSWAMLFSHPADFTPVCSTELAEIARRQEMFDLRNVKPIGLSIDSIHSHQAWKQNLKKILGVDITYPMIADHFGNVAQKYGMIHPGESNSVTVRAVFFIDPKHVIRAIIYYPLNVGRNIDELIRVIDALQFADQHSVACPVNWKPGDPVIIPPPKTDIEVEHRLEMTGVDQKDFYLTYKTV